MKSLILGVSFALLASGFSAQASTMIINLGGDMTVQSTAILGNWDDACASKGKDTEKLIEMVDANNPELKDKIGQKSFVDKGGMAQDCLYNKGTVKVLCSPRYLEQSCFTQLSLYSEDYEFVFHTAKAPVMLSTSNTVYTEMDGSTVTWVSVEAK